MENKKRKRRTDKKSRQNRWVVIIAGIMSAFVVVLVAAMVIWLIVGEKKQEALVEETQESAIFEASTDETDEDFSRYLDTSTIEAIVGAGKGVTDALGLRPKTVEMTPEHTADFATVESTIVDRSKVQISVKSEGIPKSDDKYYYLFEQATYEGALTEESTPLAKVYKNDDASIKIELNKGASNSRLFSKFHVAVKKDGQYVSVSHPKYITNPEACADFCYKEMSHKSIKGILPDPLRISELEDLGCEYATYNIPLSHILVTSGGIPYSYGGVTYHFNTQIMIDYDNLFKKLNNMGIDVAAIILNNASVASYPEITHPSARSGSTAPYYMFNAANDSGVKALAAIASFLANRYSGSGHGNVNMWIVANEVNARKEYNYMAHTDVETYTNAFTDAFRVFYNSIKSQNSAAKVYISLDQRWTYNTEKTGDYDAKDVLDIFAGGLRDYGNIDWGLAAHPYSFPNENTAFWKSSKYVNHTVSTPCITMDNIEVLTNYMKQESMLDTSGNVRSIILSEIGYSSTSGQALQAAAFAYAYAKMEQNGYIDALMLSRQTDAADEIAALGLALGLQTTGGQKKQAWNVFKYIDTDKRSEYTSFAYDIVGKTF